MHAMLLLLVLSTVMQAQDDATASRQRASSLWIDEAICHQTLIEGQTFEVAVDYTLAPGPPASLVLSGHGPWIDLPDGKYETRRHHVDYPGLHAQAEITPGHGRQVFTFTVPKLGGRDGLIWIASFKDGTKNWPWEVRQACGPLQQADPPLHLAGTLPGNLYTYAETLRFAVSFGSHAAPGSAVDAQWQVIGRDGAACSSGKTRLTVPPTGTSVPLEIACVHRGVFGLSLTIDGVGTAETTFARIPDVLAITQGEPTRFGIHDLLSQAPDALTAARMDRARRLGLTFCRQFISWKALEPQRGNWHLDGLSHALDLAKGHGIAAMLCITDPPPWVMSRRMSVGYEPFGYDASGWSDAITTMTRRFKGRLAAWEWLNEIVPGSEPDPLPTYLAMVRQAHAAAKAEDPQVLSVLAGGLWPRNFRLGLLASGIGQDIDVLPVHYSSGEGVAEASADLAHAGASTVQVWDDETGRGVSTWGMPMAEALGRTEQRAWVMDQYPGELAAGAQRIVTFGGGGDPAGNWDLFWSDGSPRPVAASLALLTSKLHRAQPQGSFTIGAVGRFQLFAVGASAVLIAPAGSGSVPLRVGSPALTLTDDQGEERQLSATAGDAEVPLGQLPTFVEGGVLDVLRGYTAPELLNSQLSVMPGNSDQLHLRLTNRSTATLAGTLQTSLPAGWSTAPAMPFSLAPGQISLVELNINVPSGSPTADHDLELVLRYDDARLPQVHLRWQLSVIDPSQLGNLLADGDFAAADHGAWKLSKEVEIAADTSFTAGLGQQVLRMGPASGWRNASQTVALSPGHSYLYSAWIHVEGRKDVGSNIDQVLQDGSYKAMFTPQVFSAANTPDWQFLAMVYHAPENLAKVSFTPVANGPGTALFDHVRVTAYDGTLFAAEATHLTKPPTIDGDLSQWQGGCPIPLLGPGQTTVLDPHWQPGAGNLRGVVKLAWDERNLYLAAWVDDDVLCVPATGENTCESDSLVLALHPGNRVPGSDGRAFCYYLSLASPGGGSGHSTLYRPAAHCGGLSSGQLARDSSIYELVIRRDGMRTLYEARLPWSELGCVPRNGLKLGCSLELNDNDGHGRAAYMTWGDGLEPVWSPALFGELTLKE